MPLTGKGKEIMSNMKEQYGSEEGERVFYASKNAGNISGVDAVPATPVGSSQAVGPTQPASPLDSLPMTIGPDATLEHARKRWDVWNCNSPEK